MTARSWLATPKIEWVRSETAVKEYLDFYLSAEHLAHPGVGCPVPSLAGEIARGSEGLKAVGRSSIASAQVPAEGLPGSERVRREQALRELAMRAGAVLIARASHPELAEEVLRACQSANAGAIPVATTRKSGKPNPTP